jgi:ribonuclease E
MANKMLIDTSHPEETRVVVLRGNRVEEFDFESASKKQLRGNIYLAKVTRVEPSLQAAFIDYGGNRHGFLAFSEIHPDYYQIPVADRQALLEEEARAQLEEDDEDGRSPRRSRRRRGPNAEKRHAARDETLSEAIAPEGEPEEATPPLGGPHDGLLNIHEHEVEHLADEQAAAGEPSAAGLAQHEAQAAPDAAAGDESEHEAQHESDVPNDDQSGEDGFAVEEITTLGGGDEDVVSRRGGEREQGRRFSRGERPEESDDEAAVEQIGGDAMEEVPNRMPRLRRQYKIQEVIKRRQVLLVQVVKEERGNKGAALTTYLSLAGRYSVLMPNTARGGGISRKITTPTDRKRLKAIAAELEVPEGMGVILRTAGAARTKAEIKRDFEYLLRMWETVRELTLKSTAAALVYEEGSLIKRAIRDLYNKDIDEVIVAGDEGYREAKDFMRLLMPSHAKNVKPYRDAQPIFAKAGAEAQLDAMFSNQVTLKSGGYIVINQTEALVAIDVNSGRSTREHNIEDTALRTNLEAADEIARQLRLRDLAGLIVVDFIDMEEGRNNRAVERRIKDALKNDRARIQVGRISHFGLLEMSRQRIRTGVLEGSTIPCPHCAGAGMVRSTASIALHVLRVLEDALIKNAAYNMTVRTRSIVALYILNQKRPNLQELERRFGVSLAVAADDGLTGTTYHALERGELAHTTPVERPAVEPPPEPDAIEAEEVPEAEDEVILTPPPRPRPPHRGEPRPPRPAPLPAPPNGERPGEEGTDSDGRRRRRRRRRRGRGGEREGTPISANAPQPSDAALAMMATIGGHLPEGGREPTEPAIARYHGPSPSREAEAPVAPRETDLRVPHEPAILVARQPAAPLAETRTADLAQLRSDGERHPEVPSAPQEKLVEPDSDRPKRTGWWARAKQTFGGE